MAIWTFPTVSNASTLPQNATLEALNGAPTVQQFFQNIDNSGTTGRAYTDVNLVAHTAGNALSWTDIKGTGSDAELHIKINTTGWSSLNLRFDYKSRSADGFDIEYSLNNGSSWNVVATQTPITDGFSWHSKSINLSAYPVLNDAPSILIKLYKFDDTGNDELVIDNIEITGTSMAEIPGMPYIYIDTLHTTKFLNLKRAIAGNASGVINDPTDPASTKGIYFLLRDSNTPLNTMTLTASSSNNAVVPNSNLVFTTINDSIRKLTVQPTGVGYSNIVLTLSDGSNSNTYTINYAASLAAVFPSQTNFHTGFADASSAIDVGGNFRLICDDESNLLYLVHKDSSGIYQKTFDMGTPMNLVLEGDFEASFRKSNRSYWIGSLGNSESGNIRVDRHKFFSADISGSGINTNVSFVGSYNMRNSVIAWGDANGYDFTSSAASGKPAKEIDGFNVEGMALGPDNTSIYLGFRAPLVPTGGASARTKALICPVLNFETWFNNGNPIGAPTFGNPIELDLGGRSIRSIERTPNGEYLIVAGDYDVGNLTFALYKWGGTPTDIPVLLTANLGDLNPEGIVVLPDPIMNGAVIELVSDDGANVFYNDGTEAKVLSAAAHKKYRTLTVPTCTATTATLLQTACNSYTLNGQTYSSSGVYTQVRTNIFGCDSTITLNLTIQQPTSSNLIETACNSYTLNGQTYNNSGVYTQLLTNALGCDSTLTLNLTVRQATSQSLTETACNSYTLNGQTYNNSGVYTQLLTNALGCDSTLILNLTIHNTPDNGLQQNGNTLTANASGASYQWVDCDNGNALIPNETGQSFTATASGNYAVEITQNSCSVFSACQNIIFMNLKSLHNELSFNVFPNPSETQVTIAVELEIMDNIKIRLMNNLGQVVYATVCNNVLNTQQSLDISEWSAGVYFVEISTKTTVKTERLVISKP